MSTDPTKPARDRRPGAFALLACLSLTACGAEARQRVTVFAASSLTATFEQLAAEYERAHPGVEVALHFAGTPQLVLQLREGAPADVFASADEAQMRRVVDSGRTAAPPRVFAHNHLAIVTPKDNLAAVERLQDLARDDVAVLLCAPDVPAGRYARRAIADAGLDVRSVSDEPNVRAAVGKVALGVVDAAVVYATDARAAPDRLRVVPFPPEHDVVARYPIAPLAAAPGPSRGDAFVAFVLGDAGRRVLLDHGFTAP